MEIKNTKENYPDVKLIDPVGRFADFNVTFPPPGYPSLQTDFENPPDCGESSYKGRGRLQGLKALITGGDSGIGRAIVIAFLREGAKVAINYLPEEERDAEDLAAFVKRGGYTLERIPGDLRKEAFCEELVKEAAKRLGGIDILVNNAGYATQPASQNIADQFSTKNLLRTFETNVFAPYYLIRAAAPIMPRGGSVLFTASGIVSDPQSFLIDYGSSKGAVTYMVRALAQSLLPHGIRVNGVAPGAVYTPIWPGAGVEGEMIDQLLGTVPYKRLAQPAELAPLYVSLAEPNQTHTNGEIYSCTGSGPGL